VVVTAAIQLFARAEVRLGGRGFRLVSEDLDDRLEVSDSTGLARDGRLDLLKAALRMLPVGGCTLTTRSDAPPGSGLGSSGALDVALEVRGEGDARHRERLGNLSAKWNT